MVLCPGDLLVLKWLTLDDQPTSSYLIICVHDDRFPPEFRVEPSFWYYHPVTQRVVQTPHRTITDAVERGELEVVDVFRVN